MRAAQRVLILHDPQDAFDTMPYVIHIFMQEWRRRGIPVEVASDLKRKPDPHTLVIPHLDITRTPDDFARYLRNCPTVMNQKVVDISKRKVSQNLISAPDEFDGPVMVKTNRNAGGEPERRRLRARGLHGRALNGIVRRLPWHLSGILGPFSYHIFDNAYQVPQSVWHHPQLVVEKFLPERSGEFYCLRQYLFFGSCELNALTMSPCPIVKARNVVKRQMLPETPPALRQIRAELGFDYGKFDYVIHEGQIILFDVARTPTYNPASNAGSPSQILLELSTGIDAYINHA